MDFDFIVDHAVKNVWCTPRQDSQVIIKPARLTANHGAFRYFKLMWRLVELPDSTSRWHVYQIGGTHPMAFDLFVKAYSWVKISESCEKQSMIADLYTLKGIKLPLADSYYRFTADHNLIIAVKITNKFKIDLNTEELFLRVYSNAYYNSERTSGISQDVLVSGKTIESNVDRNTSKALYQGYKTSPGYTFLFINGIHYHDWPEDDAADIPIGAWLEIVYDSSVKKILNLRINELDTFSSTLDDKLKYLLHYDGPDDGTIDYQDDIDVYITKRPQDKVATSVYYNKNNEDAMRNLTHRDYSIVTTYVKRLAETFDILDPGSFNDPLDLIVTLIIRNSGYERPLVYENSRIHELYKMKDLDVRRAMTGIDATVSVWRAENLEHAAYPLVMRSQCCDITNQMVEDAYGYNAISKILADTPSIPFDHNGELTVDVPYRLQYGCTAYEYDSSGLLIGWYHHYVGRYYAVKNPQTEYVELIAGTGSGYLDEYKGIRRMPLSEHYTYRVFQCTAVGGIPDNKWRDVTDSNRYTMDNAEFVWIDPSLTAYTMVRSDKRFLARDIELNMVDGAMKFTLQQQLPSVNGATNQTMQVPMGQIDLFLNGRSLIRDLDYFVVFPDVYIVNKKYLNRPILSEKQKIHVRFTGFASSELKMVEEGNRGFVEHGVLSNDSKFNIRDDKVLRIVVDGRLYTRDELTFSELHSGVDVTNAMNGWPYMVKDILVPVSANTTSDTYTLREKSKKIDKAVSEYLTLKIPQPERNAPSAIVEKYQLYSPFCNKLIMDLKYGRLVLPMQESGYTRQQVLEICKPYEYLLKFDPSQSLRAQDYRYVVVHPHGLDIVLDMPLKEYQFMHQVIEYYAKDVIVLSEKLRTV